MTNGVIHLSTDELVKAINDEYGVILAGERNTLPKAIAIGEKLTVLRPRIAPNHGDWKSVFKPPKDKEPKDKEPLLQISYETATVYIRLFERQADWRKLAADKHVEPTSLTIEDVLRLLAKPKPETGDKPKSAKAAKAAIPESATDPKPNVSGPPDEIVRGLELDYGDMFEALKRKYDNDELLELTKLLAESLGMKLEPLPATIERLREALGNETQLTQ